MKKARDTVEVTFQQGGMMEFAETGVYPEYLTVYSPKWDVTWHENISGGKMEGSLYAGMELAYTYRRIEDDWEFRDAEGNLVDIDSMGHIMAD